MKTNACILLAVASSVALGLVGCSEETLSPATTSTIYFSCRLGTLPDAAPSFDGPVMSPAAAVALVVKVTGGGLEDPITVSRDIPPGGGPVSLEVVVPQASGLVFEVMAKDAAGVTQYEWASEPIDLSGVETYALNGGNPITLEPQPPEEPLLTGYVTGETSVHLDWTQSEEADFVKYELYYSLTTPVTRGGSVYYGESIYRGDTEVDIDGLTTGTSYYFRIFVGDTEDFWSGSNHVLLTPQGGGPTACEYIWYSDRDFDGYYSFYYPGDEALVVFDAGTYPKALYKVWVKMYRDPGSYGELVLYVRDPLGGWAPLWTSTSFAVDNDWPVNGEMEFTLNPAVTVGRDFAVGFEAQTSTGDDWGILEDWDMCCHSWEWGGDNYYLYDSEFAIEACVGDPVGAKGEDAGDLKWISPRPGTSRRGLERGSAQPKTLREE